MSRTVEAMSMRPPRKHKRRLTTCEDASRRRRVLTRAQCELHVTPYREHALP